MEQIRAHLISAGKFFSGDDGRVGGADYCCDSDDDKLREGFIEKLYLPQSTFLLEAGREAVEAGNCRRGQT